MGEESKVSSVIQQQQQLEEGALAKEAELISDNGTLRNAGVALQVPRIVNPSNAGRPELKGVSVYWMRHGLLRELESTEGLSRESKIYEIEDLSSSSPGLIRRKGLHVVCPMFGHRVGAAYVHCLEGDDNVGDATHMLSYTWGYTIGDIVETLEGFCATHHLDPKRTYIWICCLCNNQHQIVEDRQRGRDTPFDDFERVFKGRVMSIGRLICMMTPWNRPAYITRVWCIFEIFTAMTTVQKLQETNEEEEGEKGCEIFVTMPPQERGRMFQAVVLSRTEGMNELYDAFSNTRVEDARASVPDDKEKILRLLGGADGSGFAETNIQVNIYLRQWAQTTLLSFLEESRRRYETGEMPFIIYRLIQNNTGSVFTDMGLYDKALLAYREVLTIVQNEFGENHKDAAVSLNNIGEVLRLEGKDEEALVVYRKAAAIFQLVSGSEHADTATAFNNVGLALDTLGRHEEALVEFHKAAAMLETAVGKDHHLTAMVYSNIGLSLRHLGRYEEALTEYLKALAIREAIYGKEHPDAANSYNNVGVSLFHLRRYEEALTQLLKALRIRETSLGPDHPETNRTRESISALRLVWGQEATTYNDKGLELRSSGRYEEAIAEYRKALAIRKVALGKDDPGTAQCYNNIAVSWYHLHRYEEALEDVRKALQIRESALGQEHPDTKSTKENMATIMEGWAQVATNHNETGLSLKSERRYEEALMEYRKALRIRQALLGKDHPGCAQVHNNMGVSLFHLRRYEKAMEELQKALQIREVALGHDHEDTKSTKENMAAIQQSWAQEATRNNDAGISLKGEGMYEEALVEYRKALSIRSKALGHDHPSCAQVHNNMGVSLFHLQRYDEALKEMREALRIRESTLGPDHADTKSTKDNMAAISHSWGQIATTHNDNGLALKKEGHYHEALVEYCKALTIRQATLGESHPMCAQIHNNIGVSLYHLENYEDALEEMEKALRIRESVLGPDHPDTKSTKANIAAASLRRASQK